MTTLLTRTAWTVFLMLFFSSSQAAGIVKSSSYVAGLKTSNLPHLLKKICKITYQSKSTKTISSSLDKLRPYLPNPKRCPELMRPILLKNIDKYSRGLPEKMDYKEIVSYTDRLGMASIGQYFILTVGIPKEKFISIVTSKKFVRHICTRRGNKSKMSEADCYTYSVPAQKICIKRIRPLISGQIIFKKDLGKYYQKLISCMKNESNKQYISESRKLKLGACSGLSSHWQKTACQMTNLKSE